MNELGFRSKKVLGFGEIMLRLTPPNNQKIIQANSFEAVYSGGEANVIASLAILGHDTKFVTKLPDNYLGKKVISKFRGYNVDVNDIVIGEGRLGVYYSEIGHGLRSTEVIYDRKYSAISMASKDEFNIDNMLKGVGLVHLSGITPALSKDLKMLIIEIAKECKKKGILVSYDSNYRSKLWSIDEAKEVLEEILNYVDFAFLGSLDMINILKFEDNSLDFDEKLQYHYEMLFKKYPNLRYAACTKRVVNSINNNTLKGYLFNGKELLKSNLYTFDILDRVGGGDAFTAGILHGILNEMPNERVVEFGTCASSLKHSIIGDINIIDEDTINSVIDNGLCNVKR
ncbi:TPA: PfkB family carbohydrate kinase [Clostridium perfringens]|uniref:sugar kinase n=1 Tax=Clostridium perfringens TaxID=1502 RepID=UPI0018978E0C|nr:sugar kinase [Clostridium perfringens]ELC8401442.1 sugar kinase [Clostridium perfringens]MDH5095578.1 2-dehydro-3-deoxygluconokinase [Clostridium perfringens]MDH5098996.1 2-dehydro-3-deoxygluconokinase [Clostridium perfringens]MDM0948854.1 sugar kinase [Clostridium perfringens]MDM0969281.1 sugar kinase [Clostridium perfringens]